VLARSDNFVNATPFRLEALATMRTAFLAAAAAIFAPLSVIAQAVPQAPPAP
jgi:hypothetical protein